jgi:hypothetical protein
VGGEYGVVWFNNGSRDLWGWIDGETELGFFTIIDGKSFEEKGTKTRSSSSTDGVEDKETLETSALIGKFSNSIEAKINDFFTNGVVSSSKVVGSIFFTGDELFWVEKLSVCSCSNLINNSWFKIKEDASWDVFTSTSFREKGVESIITTSNGFVGWHLTVWLDTVLKAEEFPAGVTNLDTGLTNVD